MIPVNGLDNRLNSSPAQYATAAALANTVSAEMLARLEWVTLQPTVVLDVGCGTGRSAGLLQQRYPTAQIIALDIAYPMLQFAKEQVFTATYVCADTNHLPLRSHSVDLIFANLVLPWCANLEKVLQEWRRVLRPEGLLMFSSFGPDTLRDWRSQLADFTLPNLVDMHEIGDALTRTKFSAPVLDVEHYTLNYQQREIFFQELIHSQMLIARDYAAENVTDKLKAKYEIVYGHAFGPEEIVDQTADEFGVVNIPLARLRRQLRA